MNSTFELGRHAARALKPYPDYKDSGVPWLGKVPSHWAVRRIRTIASVISGATPSSNTGSYWEGHIAWVTPQDLGALGSRYMTTSARRITRKGYEACGATMAPAGSVVISTRAPIGHTGILSSTACTNQGCRLLVPNGAIQPEHLYYSLKVARPELESIGQGTTFAELSRNELARFAVPVAPRREQAAIVRFLDHADRRIRRYIRAKQKLIALLEEQKQAIIHQAVTGQIDVRTGQPHPAYKPSGVEWLGDVPTHWAVRRARYIFREINERSQEGAEQHLSMSQRLGLVPSHLVENRTLVSESYAGGKLCRTGDLVLNRLKAHLGVFARAQQSGVISADYTVLRPNRGAEAEYFEELLRSPSCRGELRIRAKGIVEGFWRLYTDDLYDIYLPLPPEEEQRSIIRWIESVGARIERSSASGNREIVLLYEYRARLIADVVTGKLDVREAAAGLPNVDPLAAEEDPDDGSNLEARLDGDEVGVTVHEAEA